MAKFYTLGCYTAKGLGGFVSNPSTDRKAATSALAASVGAKVTRYAGLRGKYDCMAEIEGTFEQAAAFHTAYLTAYVSLVRRGNLTKGEALLVHGSTGGVGMAAVQLGKYLGATVIATGTSEEKLEFTKKWGADHTLLTHKDNIVDFLETLEEDDDVQNVYSNVNLGSI